MTGAIAYLPKKWESVPQQKFEEILTNNCLLIRVFQDSILQIKEYLPDTYLFLLTNVEGVLLDLNYSQNIGSFVSHSPIKTGMYFTEQSCGINAISEAMKHDAPVYLPPEEHESPAFKDWHCFSVPLKIDQKTIGYLDVSTIHSGMNRELVAITKLLPAQMVVRYQEQCNEQETERLSQSLTERQLKVLQLISRGYTVKAIAIKLKIKECTVNHHKKIIFEKLGVQSSTEAVSIAARHSIL
ncbi:transcriptional regulator NarL [compost metagenome]